MYYICATQTQRVNNNHISVIQLCRVLYIQAKVSLICFDILYLDFSNLWYTQEYNVGLTI